MDNETRCKPDVLGYEDIERMVPALKGHRRITTAIMKFLALDKVNALHARNCDPPGPGFVKGMIAEMNVKIEVNNEQVLDNLPPGAFITVSNHPLGAYDGIVLIYLLTQRRPKFKVMVNMILNHIGGMKPNFIAVDALASDDPRKKAVSMQGIKEAIRQVKSGEPLGFFPAGAVAKLNGKFQLEDREWQPNIIRLIKQLKVPVIPIYFHDSNSWFFNLLGKISWQLRTLRLPREVFRCYNRTFHVTVGDPISVADQEAHGATVEELGAYLRKKTFELRSQGYKFKTK